MSIMFLEDYYNGNTLKKLKAERDCPKMLLTIFNFALSPMIQSLMNELDSEFKSKCGRKAYPRTMLLIIVLYCFSIDIANYDKMEEECKKNKFLLIATCGLKPSRNTFANFLNKSDEKVIKKVFIATLVLLNDLHFLDFVKLFVDGTDAIVRASRYNKIKRKEVEALKLVEKWGLLHNNTISSINRTIKGLEEKLEIYKNDEELCKTIKLILKRINLYTYDQFSKIEIYEEIMDERGAKSVSISFPKACWMKTKRGLYDFAFNLQEIMTENHIILVGILLPQPNDKKTIKEVIINIFEAIELFSEMQKEFGERENSDKIKERGKNFLLIADSGYFSTENLYYLFIHKINALIMPKRLSEAHNNKLRSEEGHEEKRKGSERKLFKRVKNGYICPMGRFMRLIKVKLVKHRKPHPDDGLPDNCKEKTFYFQTNCEGCPNIENCKHKTLKEKTTGLLFQMTDKFLDKAWNIHYPERFSRSEGINGFLKGDNGVLKLIGTTENAVNNEIQLRNTIYNLTRLINLKDTAY